MTRVALIILLTGFNGSESPPLRGWKTMEECIVFANHINQVWKDAKAKCVLR